MKTITSTPKNILIDQQFAFPNPTKEIFSELTIPKEIIITMHRNPDADAMGSSLGLYHFLVKMGHTVTVVAPTNWPDFLNWMPGIKQVLNYENNLDKENTSNAIKKAHWIFCLDFERLSRLKDLETIVAQADAKRILIDHHPRPAVDNFHYGISNIKKSSASEMVYDFICAAGYHSKINVNIAKCLYAGIIGDTGSFRYPSTSPSVHRAVANLKSIEFDHSKIHDELFGNLSISELHFHGHILSKRIETFYEGKIALITVPQSDLIEFNQTTDETGKLINYAMSLKGVEMGTICIETLDSNERIRLSFRSKGNFDVSAFAKKYFKGGGHSKASGGRSSDSLEETVQRFMEAIKENASQL